MIAGVKFAVSQHHTVVKWLVHEVGEYCRRKTFCPCLFANPRQIKFEKFL